MPKVSEAYKVERRAILLESALHCFGEKGFEVTTIDDIVKHAGVSKGAVYHYFKSKEEIYRELIEAGMDQYFQIMRAEFETANTTVDKLKMLIQEAVATDCIPERRRTMHVLIEFYVYSSRLPGLHDTVQKLITHLRSFLVELIEEGKSRGEFRQDLDSQSVATMFWAFRNGICMNLFRSPDTDEQAKGWQEMEQMLLKYLT